MKIFPERDTHRTGIRSLLIAAFPSPAEAALVDRLRDDGDAIVSRVALEGGAVIGYVTFSRMRAPFKALALAPVAVDARLRNRGIAAALIEDGLRQAGADGWDGVFVLGEPDYYRRFGFTADAAAAFTSPYAGPSLMLRPLGAKDLAARPGPVVHAPAFDALC